jgi:uncharacterized membrane protein YhiD involved in acid resistance
MASFSNGSSRTRWPMLSSAIEFIQGLIINHNLYGLFTAILGSVFLSLVLRSFYIRFGRSLSNRRTLADTFLLLSVSVALIIFLIKSSVALALGLVGALSIVRFRAAIKEPEELVYLLFAIAIGLGFGAEQRVATIATMFLVLPCIYLKQKIFDKDSDEQRLFVNYHSPPQSLEEITDILRTHARSAELRRFDQTSDAIDATFMVSVPNIASLQKLQEQLLRQSPRAQISIVDNSHPLTFN